ncbi:MAG: hypothetical protein Q7S35_09780 [Candidatus Limnocylindrales bacterium]|nr:hypothetical protein [Candidatus Limnocylindrales bacterium]
MTGAPETTASDDRQPAPERPRTGVLAAAALLVLGLLAAVAVGASLLGARDTVPVTVVPTDPVAVVSPEPDASPPPLGETWQTLDFQAGSSGGLIEAATFLGMDLVGVGRGGCGPDNDHPTDCYGAAWLAGAGESLTRVPDQGGLKVGVYRPISGPESELFDMAMGPAGIVAIGYAYDSEGLRPRIWRSPDGRTWERVGFALGPSSEGPREDTRVAASASSAQGYVIVGWIFDWAGPAARAAAWTSPDGVIWTRAVDTADMDVGPCAAAGSHVAVSLAPLLPDDPRVCAVDGSWP